MIYIHIGQSWHFSPPEANYKSCLSLPLHCLKNYISFQPLHSTYILNNWFIDKSIETCRRYTNTLLSGQSCVACTMSPTLNICTWSVLDLGIWCIVRFRYIPPWHTLTYLISHTAAILLIVRFFVEGLLWSPTQSFQRGASSTHNQNKLSST